MEKTDNERLELASNRIFIGGIKAVISSSDKLIAVKLQNRKLTLEGQDFNVDKLSVEEGTLNATGKVNCVRYSAFTDKQSFFRRLVK